MVEVKIWACDRCEKEKRVHISGNPHKLTHESYGGEVKTEELCEDCYSSFLAWLTGVKEFDALADKLVTKELGDAGISNREKKET